MSSMCERCGGWLSIVFDWINFRTFERCSRCDLAAVEEADAE